MNRQELSQKLISADSAERRTLFRKFPDLCDVELADVLRRICYDAWTSEPRRVSAVVETLRELQLNSNCREIDANYFWALTIGNLVDGRLEEALESIDRSESIFSEIGNTLGAANTQISKLYALALLGRYDEAVECGLRAREVFLAGNDAMSAGKIEHNIGNLFLRRELYAESEPYLESAFRRFLELGDEGQAAMLENNLAFSKAAQNQFLDAERYYRRGLKRARANGLTAVEADIEASMSNLFLFQGKYDPALKFLESARQKYEDLEMAPQVASTELETADIYLELNLIPEALGFYERTDARFAELGMQAELARSLRNHATASLANDDPQSAGPLLAESERLFESEGNPIAAAAIKLIRARGLFANHAFAESAQLAEEAAAALRIGGNVRLELQARWLAGEIELATGETTSSERIFRQTLADAAGQSHQVEYLSLVSLGKMLGDEEMLGRAVDLIENSRAAVASEEFRTSFLSDKLAPYNELVKLRLAADDVRGALVWCERSRARTLLESIDNGAKSVAADERLDKLRAELNWYYSRLNRQTGGGAAGRQEASALRLRAAELEKQIAERHRRLETGRTAVFGGGAAFDVGELQTMIPDATVVEFAVVDGRVAAFVINQDRVRVFRELIDETTLNEDVRSFLRQLKTARIADQMTAENREISLNRLLRRSKKIYGALFGPLEPELSGKRLVIVPVGVLHYLPFQALFDGERYLIEKREIVTSPSSQILLRALRTNPSVPRSALLLGIADRTTPHVMTEIEDLARVFPDSLELINSKASVENLKTHLHRFDILHLACHGVFRPDNPAFSALVLSGGNLTVRDAGGLDLSGKLVTLSACETGLNKIVSGEELIGLTSGFLSAGARTLVISLWTVNDFSTTELMKMFYDGICEGKSASEALQIAQTRLMKKHPHPYFWSPFAAVGHW